MPRKVTPTSAAGSPPPPPPRRQINRLSRADDFRLMTYVRDHRARVAAAGWTVAAAEAAAALGFPLNPWQVEDAWRAHGYPPPDPAGTDWARREATDAPVETRLARLEARLLLVETQLGRIGRGEAKPRGAR